MTKTACLGELDRVVRHRLDKRDGLVVGGRRPTLLSAAIAVLDLAGCDRPGLVGGQRMRVERRQQHRGGQKTVQCQSQHHGPGERESRAGNGSGGLNRPPPPLALLLAAAEEEAVAPYVADLLLRARPSCPCPSGCTGSTDWRLTGPGVFHTTLNWPSARISPMNTDLCRWWFSRVHLRDDAARRREGLAGHRRDHLVGVGAAGLLRPPAPTCGCRCRWLPSGRWSAACPCRRGMLCALA